MKNFPFFVVYLSCYFLSSWLYLYFIIFFSFNFFIFDDYYFFLEWHQLSVYFIAGFIQLFFFFYLYFDFRYTLFHSLSRNLLSSLLLLLHLFRSWVFSLLVNMSNLSYLFPLRLLSYCVFRHTWECLLSIILSILVGSSFSSWLSPLFFRTIFLLFFFPPVSFLRISPLCFWKFLVFFSPFPSFYFSPLYLGFLPPSRECWEVWRGCQKWRIYFSVLEIYCYPSVISFCSKVLE